jgi:hypothetical protein
MYRPYLLGIFAAIFFGYHILYGAWICYNEFCPGESESDWVYEYTDDDGKRYIMIEGKPIDKDMYDRNLGIGKYDRDSK